MPEEHSRPDFTKPGGVSPHPSSRPLIVGHHPVMADPMLRPVHKQAPPAPQMPQPLPADFAPPPPAPAPTALPPMPAPAPMPAPPGLPPATSPPPQTPAFEPIGELPPQQPALGTQQSQNPAATTDPLASPAGLTQPQTPHHELPISEQGKAGSGARKLLLWVLLPLIILIIGAYLAVDSGVVKTQINLPFHVFKQTTVTTSKGTITKTTASNTSTNSPTPAGFSNYDDSALPFSFNYPTIWGSPSVTTEPGFSKRGGDNKSDGTFAYFVTFASNKDVQMVVTSGTLLPPTRATQYYDYLNWCISPTDKKAYQSILTFTTAGGVDTPSKITCNQGPLNNVAAIDGSTIVQLNTKSTDGKAFGDLYTKNLGNASIPVVHVRDITMTNGDNIKVMLNNQLSSSSKSQ
jgi:hypothetical protein